MSGFRRGSKKTFTASRPSRGYEAVMHIYMTVQYHDHYKYALADLTLQSGISPMRIAFRSTIAFFINKVPHLSEWYYD